jgi:hypothetical protein
VVSTAISSRVTELAGRWPGEKCGASNTCRVGGEALEDIVV